MMTKQANSDLTRSEAALIRSHWTTVRRTLPHPQSIWRWGETGLPHRVLHRWKWAGLIECVDNRNRLWRTSMQLWCHVIEKADAGEVVGAEACGQEVLPTGLEPRDPDDLQVRVLADTSSDRPERYRLDRQATLSGESMPVSEIQTRSRTDKVRVNREKGERNSAKADLAAADPAQTSLQMVERYDLSQWNVTVPWFRSTAVTAPQGAVY